jgi:FkbM family methyltransferase
MRPMNPPQQAPQIPFTLIVPTVYGQMLVNRHDINQTNALFKGGVAVDHNEIVTLAKVLRLIGGEDQTVVDVGANFGAYTLALANIVGPRGQVHAFEPQRIIFNMVCGSVALNSLTNVYVHHMAVGDREGQVEIPQFDYNKPLNFGSIEFTSEQREQLTQARGHDPERVEFVPLTTIDRFAFDKLHLMKIDAEGMEMSVLLGAEQTIRRCRPVLYVEFLKCDKEALRQRITGLDYAVYENGINFLCIPSELKDRIQVNVQAAG